MTESQNNLQINSKRLPKWIKYLILLVPVIISFFQVRMLDNDFYFLHATGEYIVNHGIPYTDMLSLHSSMKIVVQQWLSAIIFYFSYNTLGEFGVLALLYVFNVIIIFLTYRLTSLISQNEIISAIIAALMNILIFDAFMVTRPQMFTYAVLLAEVCLLEKYVQSGKIKYLIGVPVLSLLLINLHAAMWPMILVLMLPYLISAIPLHTKIVKHDATGDLLIMIAMFFVTIVIGLLNPYGIDGMLYLIKSYGNNGLDVISEMEPTSFSGWEGITFFVVYAIAFLLLFFVKKKSFSIRFFLLFIGMFVFGLMQIKGIPYSLLFGIPAFSYVTRGLDFTTISGKLTKIVNKRIKVLACIFLFSALIWICEARFMTTSNAKNSSMSHYDELYKIVEILNEADEPVVLYSNFNDGQFFEFYGYHPYIDGRAELFLASNNGEYDYFSEYWSLFHGGFYYKAFIEKYQFNYLALSKGLDTYLYVSLMHDDDYEKVYDTSGVALFIRKQAVE